MTWRSVARPAGGALGIVLAATLATALLLGPMSPADAAEVARPPAPNAACQSEYSTGLDIHRSIDDEGQMASVEDWLGNTTTFGYDHDGNETLTSYPTSTPDYVCSSYDSDDLMTGTTLGQYHSGSDCGTSLAAISYGTPSPDDLIGSQSDSGSLSGSESYGYSPTDQLASDSSGSYTYNADGSPTAQANGSTESYSSSPANDTVLASSSVGPNTETYTTNSIGARASVTPSTNVSGSAGVVPGVGSSATYSYTSTGELASTSASGVLQGTFASSDDTSVWVQSDGEVVAAGADGCGQLGNDTGSTGSGCTLDSSHSATPVTVLDSATGSPLTNVVQVDEGQGFSVALTAAGNIFTWGVNTYGQLCNGLSGAGTGTNEATEVAGLSDVTSIAAGADYLLAATSSHVYGCGRDANGELGNGHSSGSYTSPQTVSTIGSGVTELAAGTATSYALVGGDVWAWGEGSGGELGNGGTSNASTPQEVSTSELSGVTEITSSMTTAIAVTGGGNVYAWGTDAAGQIGNGSTGTGEDSPYEVTASGFGDVTSVAESNNTSLALSATGEVYAWGSNEHGEFGNGTTSTTDTTSPAVEGQGATGLMAGGMTVDEVMPAGTVYSWGYNAYGETGTGSTATSVKSPTEVTGVTATGQTLYSTSYTYGGDGLRNSETEGGETSQFTYEGTPQTPTLASDGTAMYIDGPKGTPVEKILLFGSTTSYYLSTTLGSTLALVAESGSVVSDFSYSSYGAISSDFGPVNSTILLAGSVYDTAANLYYLDARYYDPDSAQFSSVDPDVGITLQPYNYGADDPINEIDPLGKFGICVGAIVPLKCFGSLATPSPPQVGVGFSCQPISTIGGNATPFNQPIQCPPTADGEYNTGAISNALIDWLPQYNANLVLGPFTVAAMTMIADADIAADPSACGGCTDLGQFINNVDPTMQNALQAGESLTTILEFTSTNDSFVWLGTWLAAHEEGLAGALEVAEHIDDVFESGGPDLVFEAALAAKVVHCK